MRRLALALLLVLTACGGDPLFVRFGWIEKTKYSQHQYSLGTKVLLKTGAVGVITDCWPTPYYGENPVSPSYTVRVGYNKTKNKTGWETSTPLSTESFSLENSKSKRY